jgi:hypothetical protein
MEIILKVGIPSGRVDHMLKRRGVKRRPPQIGVDDHPRGIDDAAEPGLNLEVDLSPEKGKKVIKREEGFVHREGVFSSEEAFAEYVQPFPDGFQHHRPWVNLQEIRDLGSRKNFVDLGNLTENLLRKGGRHWVSSSSGWSS